MMTKKALQAGNVCMQRFRRVPAHYLKSGFLKSSYLQRLALALAQATLQLLNSECVQVRFAGLSPTSRSTALFEADCIMKSGYEVCGEHNFFIYMHLCVMGHPCPCNPIKELLIPASNAQINMQ